MNSNPQPFARRIEQRLKFLGAVAIALFAFVLVVAVRFHVLGAEQAARTATAVNISRGAFELTIITQDYLQSESQRAAAQWESRFRSLYQLVESIDSDTEEMRRLKAQLLEDLAAYQNHLRTLVALPTKRATQFDQRRRALLSRQLFVLAHKGALRAERMANSSNRELHRLRRISLASIASATILACTLLLSVLWVILRRMRLSFRTLLSEIRTVREGYLGERLSSPASRDEFGEVLQEFELMRDELKSRYEGLIRELTEAKGKADSAAQVKSQFLASMSHEIRTPLSIIQGYIEEIAREGGKPDPHLVSKLRWNGRYLARLLNNVLHLSRAESGKLKPVLEPMKPMTSVRQAVESFEEFAREKGVVLRAVQKTPIPDEIRCDRTMLEQILLNLIGNAFKFTDRGSITVELSHANDSLVVRVIDTGMGIPVEGRKVLFQPFEDVDMATRKFGGAGLGLAISRRLAHLMGGALDLEKSEVGEGTTFRLTVPASACESRPAPASKQSVLDTKPLAGMRVLLAEDNPDLRLLYCALLQRSGAEVRAVPDGQQAVDEALTGTQDLVLMDVQMPVMDGYEAVRKLRQSGYSGAIVACTARLASEERERGRVLGFDEYIEKPATSEAMVEACARYVPGVSAARSATAPSAGIH